MTTIAGAEKSPAQGFSGGVLPIVAWRRWPDALATAESDRACRRQLRAARACLERPPASFEPAVRADALVVQEGADSRSETHRATWPNRWPNSMALDEMLERHRCLLSTSVG